MALTTDTGAAVVRSLIPARLDRLPWTRFHARLIMALGTAWILDGLERPPTRSPSAGPARYAVCA
jgi:hypothetical protein